MSTINEKMTKLFGSSWRTTVFGGAALIFGGISQQPELLSFLSDTREVWMVGFCKLMAFIFGTLFVISTKDVNVTGGKVAATMEADERLKKEKALKSIALKEIEK